MPSRELRAESLPMSIDAIPLAESDDTKACPFCGEEIKAVAVKCRHCRQLLGSDATPGVYRKGKQIVISRSMRLPPKCVKTGVPTDSYLSRELRWHPPLVLLLILLGLIPYLLVALLVQKRHRLRIPLTREYIVRRRWRLALAIFVFLGGLVALIFGAVTVDENGTLAGAMLVGGLLAVLTGIILAMIYSSPLTATYMDDEYVWIKGAGREYLADLPDWLDG